VSTVAAAAENYYNQAFMQNAVARGVIGDDGVWARGSVVV